MAATRHAKTLNSNTILKGSVASIEPFSLVVALQKPPPLSGSTGDSVPEVPGTNWVGRTISGTAAVASPASAVGLGVLVGSGVNVAVGTTVGVAVGGSVGSGIGVGSGVSVGDGIGVFVGVNVGLGVGVNVGDGVNVGEGVGVIVGVLVSVGVGVIVGVSVGVGVGVGVKVGRRSGNTNVTFSKFAPLTNAPGGESALRNSGAPEGSFRSTKKKVTGAFRYFLSTTSTVMKYSAP